MLGAMMTCTRRELEWLYRGLGCSFLKELLAVYSSMTEDLDPAVRARAASAWVAWEDAVLSLETNGRLDLHDGRSVEFKIAFARICAHYFAHGAFLEDGVLMRDVHRLAGIPGILMHGRADLSLPVITVWELARAWGSDTELIVVDDAGHTGSPALRELQRDARSRLSAMVAPADPG